MGPEVSAFEDEFAGFIGVKHALAVANGTAALHLALLALGIGPGDEVIQPAINFVAAANMTAAVGAVPIFADILALEEPTIDPASIEAQITSRTRAVVVMHYGGYSCRMNEIRDVCRRYDLTLIEDACHAVGATSGDNGAGSPGGQSAGGLGDISCFSFFSNKNLATGEGGMVATDRDDLADRVRKLRSHGMTTLTWDRHRGHGSSYDVARHGYNYRTDEVHAALGRAQLIKVQANNESRRRLVARYADALADLSGWIVPFAGWHHSSAYHLMIVVAPDVESRQIAVQALREARVQTSLHYPCIPDFGAFGDRKAQVPRSRSFATRAISLPLHPMLQPQQVDEICAMAKEAARIGTRPG
jgi:dTDP-4-amino-4,6-dideoxygalactose transaminase